MTAGAHSSSTKISSGFCKVFDFIDSPISSDCCEKPFECFKNIFINYSANLNFSFLSSLSFSDSIINTIDNCAQATLTPQLKQAITSAIKPYFEIVGKSKSASESLTPPLNLIDFIVPCLFLYFTADKVKNSTVGIFKSISQLAKGVLLGEWSSNVNLRKKNVDYIMNVEISQKHTLSGLSIDVIIQTAIAATWGGLAFLTQRGMRNALANATNNPLAQDAITGLNAAIITAHLLSLSINLLKKPKMQLANHYHSEEPITSNDSENKGSKLAPDYKIDIFDLSDCDPKQSSKQRNNSDSLRPSLPALDDSFDNEFETPLNTYA